MGPAQEVLQQMFARITLRRPDGAVIHPADSWRSPAVPICKGTCPVPTPPPLPRLPYNPQHMFPHFLTWKKLTPGEGGGGLCGI